jgi:hypothetical protein
MNRRAFLAATITAAVAPARVLYDWDDIRAEIMEFASEEEEADWLYEHRDEIRGPIVRDDDGRPLSPAEIRARHLKRR